MKNKPSEEPISAPKSFDALTMVFLGISTLFIGLLIVLIRGLFL